MDGESRRSPSKPGDLLREPQRGEFGEQEDSGEVEGCEAKGAASLQQVRYEAMYEWSGKMKRDVDKKTRKIDKNKIRKEAGAGGED